MAYNGPIYAGSLFDINVGASTALGLLNPLMMQVDATLFGSLGLGAIQADMTAQLSASLSASMSLGLSISNPLEGWIKALAALDGLIAAITAALAGSVPMVSIDVTTQLAAQAAFAAQLTARIGGLEAILQALLSVKIPAMSFAASLSGALAAGPLMVLSFDGVPLADVGNSLQGDFSAGVSRDGETIAPGDTVYGMVVVTRASSAWTALQTIMMPL